VVFGEDSGNKIGVLVPSLASGVVSGSVATSAPVTPVTITPTPVAFSVTPTTSTASVTTATSSATLVGGFREYPTLSTGGEGPHLVVVGPNEKVVYSRLSTTGFGPGNIELLELPPAGRCRK
jgi:hypothetical protein